MIYKGCFPIFISHWPVSLTMIFGSFIAGATAEGGGAVAFPVFTKWLHVSPVVARDFALAIQSIGMTCGSLLIIKSGYKFLPCVFGWTFLGSGVSIIIGLKFLAPMIPPHYSKIIFSLFTLSFGFFLYVLNKTPRSINTELSVSSAKRRFGFFITGFLGGLVSSLVGSGADVVLFVILCLRYQIDEKIATRTTVFLMASVSMVGFAFKMLTGAIAPQVIPMWLVAVPIVAFGAPLGASFCSWQKRENVVLFLILLIILEFATTLWLVPFDKSAIYFSAIFLFVSLLSLGFLFYFSRQRCIETSA